MFEKYSTYLDEDFSVDYWSDEGIGCATTFLEKFTDSDWVFLKDVVRHKPVPWMIRCAETLGDIGGGSSFDVLLELIAVESDEVKISALDSMNSRLSLGFALDESAGKIRSAIKAARSSAGIVASMMLDSLEKSWVEAKGTTRGSAPRALITGRVGIKPGSLACHSRRREVTLKIVCSSGMCASTSGIAQGVARDLNVQYCGRRCFF